MIYKLGSLGALESLGVLGSLGSLESLGVLGALGALEVLEVLEVLGVLESLGVLGNSELVFRFNPASQAFPPSRLGRECLHSLLSAWRRFRFPLSTLRL